ncbi:hypothetical protein EV363DRAFT_1339937 [Boletus edulis]|uniref:Yeast cell wall synthesis Kre9/Knh1-like N-terminal domain-containing protein n=1 Tax=Boletus edulis BED1 TaxID=1328754 RepID=A0AAD4GMF4_BOLED|nr:hypothetical protein EV363DRAFT_1339937 [Boletus edulis]KAF8452662.1 hypothetical protein L210DRAFT_3519277 [Boletus edulis BED1]
MFTPAIVSLAFAASALANVFITTPVVSTTFNAGQQSTVSWQDSGSAPSLTQFGNASFAIYVGNAIQQTLLQTIATNVNVSATSSFTFTPDGTIGPNSSEYFIRVTSLSYMSPQTPQFPEEAFSAMFTLAGMTGTFNSTIQAEINGQSTAPIGGTSTPSSPMSTASGSATMSMPMSGTMSMSSSSPTSTGTTSSSGGVGRPVMATGLVVLVATLVGASLL